MSVIATAMRELIAAGVTGDALVTAIERISAAWRDEITPKRSNGARRQAAYRERHKASQSVTVRHSDVTVSSPASPLDGSLTLLPIISPSPPPSSSEANASATAAPMAVDDGLGIPGFLRRQPSPVPAAIEDIDVVDEDPKARLFRLGKTILASFGVAEKRTGAVIGQWLKIKNDPAGVLAAIQFARDQSVAEPVAYVSAIVHSKAKNGAGTRTGPTIDELIASAEKREGAHDSGASFDA